MSKKRIKQYLMLLTVVGLVSIASGSGTFASFTADVTNPGNTFAAGTLFLHEAGQDSSGSPITACNSETGALNVNATCDVLFNNVDLSAGAATAQVDLHNDGTTDANHVKFSIDNCSTAGDNFAHTGTHQTFGSAPACTDLRLTIQETQADHTTPVACAYGPTSDNVTCNPPDAGHNLGAAGSLTNLLDDTGAAQTLDNKSGSTPTRYYVITIDPVVASGNTLQNRKVAFDMSWELTQA